MISVIVDIVHQLSENEKWEDGECAHCCLEVLTLYQTELRLRIIDRPAASSAEPYKLSNEENRVCRQKLTVSIPITSPTCLPKSINTFFVGDCHIHYSVLQASRKLAAFCSNIARPGIAAETLFTGCLAVGSISEMWYHFLQSSMQIPE